MSIQQKCHIGQALNLLLLTAKMSGFQSSHSLTRFSSLWSTHSGREEDTVSSGGGWNGKRLVGDGCIENNMLLKVYTHDSSEHNSWQSDRKGGNRKKSHK